MRFVLAPNTFRDSLTAFEAVNAMARGIRSVFPEAILEAVPMADGGDGTLAVLQTALGGSLQHALVRGPRGTDVEAGFLISADGSTAVIEMAEASGLRLVPSHLRDVARSSTYGTGQLILAALEQGVNGLLIGVGGSATIDGGCGALAALGAIFKDKTGRPLEPIPVALAEMDDLDLTGLDPRLAETELSLLSDVATRPENCIALYGPQKGVGSEDFPIYQRLFNRLDRAARQRGNHFLGQAWMGSGGALSAGLSIFAGATTHPGAQTIAQLVGLESRIQGTDLILTGEGRLDPSSLEGKVPIIVSQMAASHGVPTVILAGQLLQGLTDHLPKQTTALSISAQTTDLAEALSRAPELMEQACARLARSLRP